MLIQSLTLANYRNYAKHKFEFKQTTAILGPNGIGKTNILEAVRYVSIMKSFRAKREREVINWGEETTRIVAKGEVDNDQVEIAVGLSGERKIVSVNGVKKKMAEAVGILKTVLFAPDDLDFVTGPPTLRRRFIDTILSQKEVLYLTSLIDLYRVIKQRNATLQRISQRLANSGELEPWDEQLVNLSQKIQPFRQKLIDDLNLKLTERYQSISGSKVGDLEIKYQISHVDKKTLNLTQSRDIRYQATTHGPHHDDIEILLSGRPLSAYGSRGERRSAVLALKQAEVEILTDDEPPILLLDDILSELDHERQERLVSLFGTQQTIITATELPAALKKKCESVIELS